MDCRVRSQIVFCIIRFYLKEDEKRVRGSLRKVIVRVIHPYFSSFVLQDRRNMILLCRWKSLSPAFSLSQFEMFSNIQEMWYVRSTNVGFKYQG